MKKRIIKFRAWDGKEFIYMDYAEDHLWNCPTFKDVQQFTGLFDKDGKEIYEADIIQFEGTTEYGYGEIIFDNGMYWIQEKDSLLRVDMVCIETCKVIGNICENPELLS
uniref:Putative YopX protein n=2 Tax=viral metagenome TaxID=1070528 RepID=A0A6M3Y7K9_9ZZZZ